MKLSFDKISDLSTGHKLTAGFSVVLILIGIVGFVGHKSLTTVTSKSDIDNNISSLTLSTKALRKAEKNYMIREEAMYLGRIDSIMGGMNKRIENIMVLLPEDSIVVLRKVEGALEEYNQNFNRWLKIHRQQQQEARKMMDAGEEFVVRCEVLREDQRNELSRLDRVYLRESTDKLWKTESAGQLIEMVQNLRIEEKNYTLREDSSYIRKNKKTLEKIFTIVDSLYKAHEQIENRQQIQAIRDAAGTYRDAFQSWYSYNKQQERQRLIMQNEVQDAQYAGSEIERVLYKILSRQEADGEETGIEKEYNRIRTIMGGLKELNIHHKRFIMDDDDSLISRNSRILNDINAHADRLGTDYNYNSAKEAINRLYDTLEGYEIAFNDFQVAHEGLQAKSASMVQSGRHFRRETQRYRRDQQRELQNLRQRIDRETDDKLWKADAANQLIKYALETRSQEKNMMLHGDPVYELSNDTTMRKIYGLARELKDRFDQQENDRLAQTIISNAKKYKTAFNNWAKIRDQKQDIESGMINKARDVGDLLSRFENEQDSKMNETIQQADVAIIGGSTLAVMVGLGLAFFLTGHISRSQQKIQKSLDEKEILLKEIHHRVKNNLAAISGMLEMQMMSTDNSEIEDLLEDSLLRVNSIASVHKLLYESDNMDSVNLKEYLKRMSDKISGAIRNGKDIKEEYEAEDIHLNINQTIPTCLIVNELLTNAYKHAFTGFKEGTIKIRLKKNDGTVAIEISDDGRGLPDDFEPANTDSLGFKLVSSLVKQLQGDFEYSSDNGSTFVVTFEKEDIEREISEIKS